MATSTDFLEGMELHDLINLLSDTSRKKVVDVVDSLLKEEISKRTNELKGEAYT